MNTQSTAQHTPGPWTIMTQNPEGDEFYINGRGEGPVFTILCATKHAKANARLIASAPELLAALERIIAVDATYPRTIDYLAERIETVGAFQQARAAIAKAKGGAA